jgi:O-antigen/teichoic acid export membrane protein
MTSNLLKLAKRHRRTAAQAAMVLLRLGNAGAKFALTIYMARYLGLADVGAYGLIVGLVTGLPVILSFGIHDWTSRLVVGLDRSAAIPIATTRLATTFAIELAVQALLWAGAMWFGPPIGATTAMLIAAILLLEHLSLDAFSLQIGRGQAVAANILFFIRSGLWPLIAILWGLIDPGARSLDTVLLCWVGGLSLSWIAIAILAVTRGWWRFAGFDRDYLRRAFVGGVPFWIADIGVVGNLYLDRFLVSYFLGMEAAGIYTFFWSYTNVVHTLAVNGIMLPQMPALVSAARTGDTALIGKERRRIALETARWGIGLALAAGLVMPALLPLMGRPILAASLPVFALIMLGTLARMTSEGLGFVLISQHRDRTIATTAIGAVIASAALNSALIPLLGLYGAAVAYVMVGLGLTLARRRIAAKAD